MQLPPPRRRGAAWQGTPLSDSDKRSILDANKIEGLHYDDVPPNKGIYKGSARVTMKAEVHTSVSTAKNVSMLHAEIQAIDGPVFREIPERRIEQALTQAEDPGGQQQR